MGAPRVGILSMQRIRNYGSFLQAYALKCMLEELGCPVEFVDYEPGECLVSDERVRGGIAQKVAKAVKALSYDAKLGAKLAFVNHKRTFSRRFDGMLGLTMRPNLDPELDLLVVGSDEVFNCLQTNPEVGFTPTLFGHGVRARRKVSYAASFGNTTEAALGERGVKDEVAGYLAELNAVSVRDASSEALVSSLTGVAPSVHLDPVLVYDWFGLCNFVPDRVDESSYMILYGYSGRFSVKECEAIRSYAASRSLKVLNIGGVQACCDRFIDCSPFEVLAYFRSAECVVTDTFHGTVMSVVAERPFATFVRDEGYGNSEKLGDLLSRLGLNARRVSSASDLRMVLDRPIEWDSAEEAISNGRDAARRYLSFQVEACSSAPSLRKSYLSTGKISDCTGCAACAYACPISAISMNPDECGFEYPVIDQEKCIGCGKCQRACHMNDTDEMRNGDPIACYSAYDLNAEALRMSASGGVATLLCRMIIEAGGVAYGCVADREYVHHERLATLTELERSRGSKYVQSDTAGIFKQIEADLKNGTPVAFVGTPCQCASVKRLFGGQDGLLLVDLVCEGVPSRKMYADFLDSIEDQRGVPVTDFRFRDKRGGWSTKNAVVLGKGGEPIDKQQHSYAYYYYWLFTKAMILRDSCYACPYACERRVGDLTVGDFWGVERTTAWKRVNELIRGMSCVLVNSELGRLSFDSMACGLMRSRCQFAEIARFNGCLTHPSYCNPNLIREARNEYKHKGAQGLNSLYHSKLDGLTKMKEAAKSIIPISIKILIKSRNRLERLHNA